MIARLTGILVEKQPHAVLLDLSGVGYRASIPLSTFYALPAEGDQVSLRIHTHLREDLIALYGFATREELDLFERLIEISGIGPRLALAILSGLPASDLVDAIAEGDSARLRGIPGVGPKTADRVVLEMRDRIQMMKATLGERGRQSGAAGSIRRDVVSALVNLGYREHHADEAVRRVLESAPRRQDAVQAQPASLEDLLKRSLKYLAS
ncbi:MAG TPA: Holliday junction branch migration protein RuvA [Candidatus Polarisedimenticolia bacterium]|nr:Holliday junction branch migration protein RuvA [Candidatus Polarisedimenticolia bacterium]